jgi:Mn-dependent DtxR family transcriptional regulator
MPSVSALLSQALVAFTIELDNEFEHRSPHRTTISPSGQGPWLASVVMWWNCMKYVGDQPVSVKELERLARTKTNLHGMQRWGYITVDSAKMIRATPKGLKARDVWADLPALIEQRWEERFTKAAVHGLREALWTVVSKLDLDLPDCLPILGYGLWSVGPECKRSAPVERDLPLFVLLSRTLLAFAMGFERDSDLSLAICANVVRVLNEEGVRMRDLPVLSGVSKESIAMAMGILRKKNLVEVEKVVRLNAQGIEAQKEYLRRLALLEARWKDTDALQAFTTELLLRGIEPYPDNWRASVRKPSVLPHYPMVLHRGGYPDGS